MPIQDSDAFDEKLGTAPTLEITRQVYAKMVERMDARVCGIMSQPCAMSREDNTIFIYVSENGAPRGRKISTWEGGIRVPGMAQWLARFRTEMVTPQVTLSRNLAHTFLSVAGIKPPAGTKFDGLSRPKPFKPGLRAIPPAKSFDALQAPASPPAYPPSW